VNKVINAAGYKPTLQEKIPFLEQKGGKKSPELLHFGRVKTTADWYCAA
jgi:hypothetical protein